MERSSLVLWLLRECLFFRCSRARVRRFLERLSRAGFQKLTRAHFARFSEVGHDMEEDEYIFEGSLTNGSGTEADSFLRTAKKALANKLRPIFQQFPKDMIAVHGKDLLDDSTPTDSGASTPVSSSTPASASASTATSSTTTAAVKSATAPAKPAPQNTATVRATGEFQCSADDLFDFLTNPQKIPMWSRNPAQMAPEVGAEVSLFGGNIRGKVEKVDRPKGFTMSWRAPTWPEDLYGQLEAQLNQGSNSTTLSLTLRGVPVGKEDETETNVSGRAFLRSKAVCIMTLFLGGPPNSSTPFTSGDCNRSG
jgi:activator of HSP90 ATPase